jgi:hypothetical protein
LRNIGITDAPSADRYVAKIEKDVYGAAEGGGYGPEGQQDKVLINLFDQVNDALQLLRGALTQLPGPGRMEPPGAIPGTEQATEKLHKLGTEIRYYLTKALGLSWRDIERQSKSKITKAIAARMAGPSVHDPAGRAVRLGAAAQAAIPTGASPARKKFSAQKALRSGVPASVVYPRAALATQSTSKQESKLNEIIDEVINEMVKHTK